MIAFVLSGHHAAIRPNCTPCSHRGSWTSRRTIAYRASQFCGHSVVPRTFPSLPEAQGMLLTPKAMLSGGGGILGVGPSEIVVILAVGWLLLGPKKLFSLAKDTGRLLGELRRTADEARTTLNDAMELDMIAAEFEESKESVQKNASSDADDSGEISEETEKVVKSSDDPTDGIALPREAESDVEPVVSNAFLEQLQKVADPNQKPPEEVPDLDSYSDEELEVQRLEKQYFEARKRLEQRRGKGTENTTSESEPVVEER